MHPLLKRILIRGTIVGIATMAVAMGLRWAFISFVNSQPGTKIEGPTYNVGGALTFGTLGFAILAILEWIAYARERKKNTPPAKS